MLELDLLLFAPEPGQPVASDVLQLGRRERGRRIPVERGVPVMEVKAAWNICFTSGTVLLTACYEKKDALRVQGINDLVIFGVAGAGSLASGYAYTAIGWDGLVYVVCGLMGLAGIFLAGSYRAASRRAGGPEGSKSGSSLSFTISPMTGGCPAPAGMVEPWGKSVSSTSRSAV